MKSLNRAALLDFTNVIGLNVLNSDSEANRLALVVTLERSFAM